PTALPSLYTLSLHDALPISFPSLRFLRQLVELHAAFDLPLHRRPRLDRLRQHVAHRVLDDRREPLERIHARQHEVGGGDLERLRSEEHTSELQSLAYLVCRL